jgi:hypothetical protein
MRLFQEWKMVLSSWKFDVEEAKFGSSSGNSERGKSIPDSVNSLQKVYLIETPPKY